MTALTNIGVTGRENIGFTFWGEICGEDITKFSDRTVQQTPPSPSQMKLVPYNDAQNPLEQVTTQVSVNLVTDSSEKK